MEKLVPMNFDEFLKIRPAVLDTWKTGKDANDLQKNCSIQSSVPLSKRFSNSLTAAIRNNTLLLQPRAGVALIQDHIHLLKFLQNEGNADLLPTTIDSYTRLNRYEEAEKGITESKEMGRSLLNGLPVVNHGVEPCKEIISQLDKPVQIRHGTPDARLLAEISFAAGFTAFEGGGISYNIPYAKNVLLEKSIRDWQYVDRLVGFYAQQGIIINREPFGPLTGTLIPPCISNTIAILEALFAATQGVKDITVGYGQCGNMNQDIAAVYSLRCLSRKLLDRYGFSDVTLSVVFHQWMGGFPQDEAKAYSVISWGAFIACVAQATKIITKTPYEALGIPSQEANANGLKATRQMVNLCMDQKISLTEDVKKEIEIIDAETYELFNGVQALGNSDLILGTIRAFECGALDIPFAPSRVTRGSVLPARDTFGAVRFIDTGNLPFSDSIKQFHKDKMNERSKLEGRPVSFQMVSDDIYAVSKGYLIGKSH